MTENPTKQMKTGILGSILAALCCFTPVLVFGLSAVGLSAWLGWVDYVLFPLMFASMGLIAHALYLKSGKIGVKPHGIILVIVVALTALMFWLEFRYALRTSMVAGASVAAYAYFLRTKTVKLTT